MSVAPIIRVARAFVESHALPHWFAGEISAAYGLALLSRATGITAAVRWSVWHPDTAAGLPEIHLLPQPGETRADYVARCEQVLGELRRAAAILPAGQQPREAKSARLKGYVEWYYACRVLGSNPHRIATEREEQDARGRDRDAVVRGIAEVERLFSLVG